MASNPGPLAIVTAGWEEREPEDQEFRDHVQRRVENLALWARVAPEHDADAWAARAGEHGVAFATAKRFAFDARRRPFIRLGFAALNERELREAVRRMVAALG